jgi:hypothetical protein
VANTLTPIIPKLIARGLPALREAAVLPRLVRDYTGLVGSDAQKGNVLTIPKSASQAVTDVTPGPTDPSNVDHTVDSVTLTIDQHRKTFFHLTDQEATQVMQGDYVPLQMSEAFRSLANDVNDKIQALSVDFYSISGTAGTTPFGSNANDLIAARKILKTQLAPRGDYTAVIDHDAEENLLQLAQLTDADRRGTPESIMSGEVGRVLGTRVFADHAVDTFDPGTLSDGTDGAALVNNASVAIGDTSVPLDETSLTGTIKKGAIFTVAGDTQQYVVTADATAATNAVTVSFAPAAKVAWADNAAVTFFGGASGLTDWVDNVVFHPDAMGIAFARPASLLGDQSNQFTVTDPVTGIPIRVIAKEQHYQTTFYLDILFGTDTIRREYGTRIAG